MAISCEPNDLAAAAKEFQGLSALQLSAIQTYALAVRAGLTTDPDELAALARCFCNSSLTLEQIKVFLLCQIANGGSGPTTCENLEGAASPNGSVVSEFAGQVYIQDNGTIWQAALSGSTVWTIICSSAAAGALTFLMPKSDNITIIGDNGDVSYSFPNLVTVNTFYFQNSPTLTSFSAPLVTTILDFEFEIMTMVTTLNLSTVTTIGGECAISANPLLATVNLSSLASIGGITGIIDNAALTSLNLSSLTTMVGDAAISQNPLLATVNLSSVTDIQGTFSCSSNTIMSTLNLSGLQSAQADFNITLNPALTALNLSALTSDLAFNVTVKDNAALTTFTMNGRSWPNNTQTIDFRNNALNQASVDRVLHAGIVGGMTGGIISLQGGTNASPSVAGLADKAALILAGVAVTTN